MPSNIYQPRPSTIELNARTGDRGMDGAVYVNTNESLHVAITSSIAVRNFQYQGQYPNVTVNVDVRMLTVSNGLQYLQYLFVPAINYKTENFEIKLPEGLLLNVSAYTVGVMAQLANAIEVNPMLGQTWVELSIVAPVNPNHYMGTFLSQGYITNEQRVSYPPQQPISYEDGYPFFRFGSYDATNGLSYLVPQNAINEITGVEFKFTTDATPGNRQLYLAFQSTQGTPATVRNLIVPFQNAQGPGANQVIYSAFQGGPNVAVSGVGSFGVLPVRLRLKGGEYVVPMVNNPDPGDSLSDLVVWGNEWLVP